MLKKILTSFTNYSVLNRLFLILVILLFSTSCSVIKKFDPSKSSHEMTPIKVCFVKSKKNDDIFLVYLSRKALVDLLPVEAAINELFNGPTKSEYDRGIRTEIPEGTRLIHLKSEGDNLIVNITSQFLTGGGSATMQLRYLQLYKTIHSAEPNKKIFLLIDGKSIKSIGGEGLEVTQPLMIIYDYTKRYEKNTP